MKKLVLEYKDFLRHFSNILTTLIAFVLFLGSLVVNYFASHYAYVKQGNPVTDILLDNLPVINMDGAFVYGTWFVVLFIIFLLLNHPRKIPFVLKTMAIFIVVRSAFVVMTHLGPSPLNTLSEPSEIGRAFSMGADLFFSGHTGMPFLFCLMFWENKTLRLLFFLISIMAAAGVLFGHIHYSIDVASAYFITHGIYLLSRRFFKKDLALFNSHAGISN
jgi:hypothetical protein